MAVGLGLSGVDRSSDVQVCLVDDSSGVCRWVRSMGVGMCVGG